MMKRFIPTFLFSLLLIGSVQAQVGGLMFPGPGPKQAAGGGPYVGPGDLGISGVQAWAGIRAYSAAKAGTKAINLCDDTGANCSDESTNASGNLVVGTHGVNNCSTSDTCLVKTLYDQSGGANCSGVSPCDMTTSTTANMFTLKHNCRSGTQFCLVGTSTSGLPGAGIFIVALTQPITVSAVGRRTAGPTSFTNLIEDPLSPTDQLGFYNVSGSAFVYAGSVISVAGLTEGNMYAFNMLYSGASSNLNINGSSNIVSPGTSGMTGICAGGCVNGGSIEFYEAGWWSGDTSASFTSLYGNEHTYWGF